MNEDILSKLVRDPFPKIEEAGLLLFPLQLKSPFETSFGSVDHRQVLICYVKGEGDLEGYGECVADEDPFYSYETVFTAWQALEKYLLPFLRTSNSLEDFYTASSQVRGHNMAKAAIEAALWDFIARHRKEPLYRLWGGERNKIACGVSIGLQKDTGALLDKVREYRSEGYRRIKIKIKPGKDRKLLEAIRKEFPEIPLMADANAAYTLSDRELLTSLDEFHLMMIEQPLHYEDLADHALLQKSMETPVCLDESITSLHMAKAAVALNSCRIINIKTGRVGGHRESIRIHDLALSRQMPVWCGGMLESGIGRGHNLALASLPNFSLPGDTSASSRYWHRDIIDPPVEMDSEGFVQIPERPGTGYELDREYLESLVEKRFRMQV
jgi:O-succinylbenzoate synthase